MHNSGLKWSLFEKHSDIDKNKNHLSCRMGKRNQSIPYCGPDDKYCVANIVVL